MRDIKYSVRFPIKGNRRILTLEGGGDDAFLEPASQKKLLSKIAKEVLVKNKVIPSDSKCRLKRLRYMDLRSGSGSGLTTRSLRDMVCWGYIDFDVIESDATIASGHLGLNGSGEITKERAMGWEGTQSWCRIDRAEVSFDKKSLDAIKSKCK